MHWNGQFYVDTVLPFGLRSAPFLFNELANALEWILTKHGIEFVIHYLDDFLLLASTDTLCDAQLRLATAICSLLGVPLADDKFDGPTTCIRFLGILLDTIAMEARLPQDKLERLTALVDNWLTRHTASKSDLQSLIGHLYAAAKVVPPGRTFVRRLVDHLKAASTADVIHLSEAAFADLRWWKRCLGGLEWKELLSGAPLHPCSRYPAFHRRFRDSRLRSLLRRSLAKWAVDARASCVQHCLEKAVRHRHRRCGLVAILPSEEDHG